MTHRILDADADKIAIESFVSGTEIDLNTSISIGTQLYYLYKQEDDDTILSWYWGRVIEINKHKTNGEYYHIWHDDEDPWIDLSTDRTDWKLIPPNNPYYDNTFDTNIKQLNSTKHTPTNTKPPKTPVKCSTHRTYTIGQTGFAAMNPKTHIACTITHGPLSVEAVRLQHTSFANAYTFWCRKEDIKHVLPNQKLYGQRVAFEWNGTTARYRVIGQNEQKQFIQCTWAKDVNATWISIDNFYSNCPSPGSLSNKENEDETYQDIMCDSAHDPNRSNTRKQSQKPSHGTHHIKHKGGSKKKMDGTPTPSVSPKAKQGSLSEPIHRHPSTYRDPNVNHSPLSNRCSVGEKRKRDAQVSWNIWPPLKRQRLNAIQHNDDDILQLVAVQPPQPELVPMPQLQRSPTPNNNNHNRKRRYVLSDDVSSMDSGMESESPPPSPSPPHGILKNIGINVENSEICNEFNMISRRRQTLSEPPPRRCRANVENHAMSDMIPVCFPMISLKDITDQLTDVSITNEERIESMKSVVLYLTKCQNTMSDISTQIGLQCQNVICCVEAIIRDLEQ